MSEQEINLYEELEVSENADQKEIKRQYRAKAMEHHPDREGGDEEKFRKISYAYSVLSDDTKRKKYDDGEDLDERDPELEKKEMAAGLILEIIEQVNEVTYTDILKTCNRVASVRLRKVEDNKEETEESIKKLKEAKGRLKNASGFILNCMEDRVRSFNREMAEMDEEIENIKGVIDIFGTMEYTKDEHQYEDFFVTMGSRGQDSDGPKFKSPFEAEL